MQGSLERLSPILMTELTARLALIPLALGGCEPGNELQTLMAIVILGGLLSATALTMLVLPVLYWRLYCRHRPNTVPAGSPKEDALGARVPVGMPRPEAA